jgi:ABC-type multidrug transport system permease subunit
MPGTTAHDAESLLRRIYLPRGADAASSSMTAYGIPLLVLAAVIVGLVVGLQRRVTGGILGPIVTHLTWSLGMLFLLPHALSAFA